jgi:hypothetical protein
VIFAVLPPGSTNLASAERNLPGHFLTRCSGDVKHARSRVALRDESDGRANGVRASRAGTK